MDHPSQGTVSALDASDENTSYRISISVNSENTIHSLTIPDQPIRFESLSLWLDSSDPSGGSFSSKSDNILSLWLDASDSTTITKEIGSDDLKNWSNKINPAVEMRSLQRKPTFNETIDGKTALRFDANNGNLESFTAYKNGSKWNPAGNNGQASGPLSDVVVLFVWRIDQGGRTTFPFNWQWGVHGCIQSIYRS